MSGTKRDLPFVAEGILANFGDSSESDPTLGKTLHRSDHDRRPCMNSGVSSKAAAYALRLRTDCD